VKIKILEQGDKPVEWMKFKLTGAPVSFVNALRRVIISELVTLSIEDVNLLKNNSAFYDELLALRLGMVPIKADPTVYEDKPDFKVAFVLKGEGPCTLFSRDMQPMDPEIAPAFPDIPLVRLVAGQEVELEAWATPGTAKQHVKWQGGHAYFTQTKENDYEFYVESFGNMPVKEMLKRAGRILAQKGEEFGKWVDGIKA